MFGDDLSDDGLTEQQLMALLDTVECKRLVTIQLKNLFNIYQLVTSFNVETFSAVELFADGISIHK